ncbi:hypothetical protein PMIT1303_00576 [Prochlorococcus sp. MIT 1303]|nr:hypothetical protein PMIT1303_00576 [Prochlorococcus sp. MIT 1303]
MQILDNSLGIVLYLLNTFSKLDERFEGILPSGSAMIWLIVAQIR